MRGGKVCVSMKTYKHELAKARLGDNLAHHMAYIYMIILYDKFDFSVRQIQNWADRVQENRERWQDDYDEEVTNRSLIEYCEKRKIDVVGFVKSVPMSQKLYLSDMKGRGVLGADRNIESAFVATLALVIPVLKKSYRFSNDKIGQFFDWVAFYVDSYARKQPRCKQHYCCDEDIRQAFIMDEGWDIKTGQMEERE